MRVFISYSTALDQIIAFRLQTMAAVYGMTVYVPPATTRHQATAALIPEVQKELAESNVVLGVITQIPVSGAVSELAFALASGKLLIPIVSSTVPKEYYAHFLPHFVVNPADPSQAEGQIVRLRGGLMKIHFVACLVLSCLLSTVTAQTANAPAKPLSPLEQTLMAAEKSFVDAAKKGDVAYFKSRLTDDFSFVQFDGQLYDRQDMLDQFGDGGVDLMPYDMKVVTAGDGVAIVTYNVVLRVPAAEDQGPPPRYQHFSTVWVKQGDAWKMKFQQMTASHWGDW